MQASVSVVIPVFNRAALVVRALESVYAQSRTPREVIVVDDGSSDGTSEMVSERFPGAVCLREKHRGVSAARNVGIRSARGDWIALLDSDDEWLPTKLERQLDALARQPRFHLCHCDEIWMRDGRRVIPRKRHAKSGGWIFEECLPLCAISPSSAMIRRSVFAELGLFDEELPACEDYDYWLRFCSRHPVLYVDEQLVVKHGGHDDQLSRRIWGLDRFRIRALIKVLEAGHLDERATVAARRVLEEKARIFAAGARKRGRGSEAREMLRVAEQYRLERAPGGRGR
jgi:glycosyltransferase involved in cell wall biosynthesis